MKVMVQIIAIVAFVLALASCATTKKADFDSVKPSPILSLTGLTLDGENWVKTQFRYNGTKEPIANRECIIYVLQGDDVGEIRTRTDENGFVFVEGIPGNDGVYIDFVADITIEDDEENEMEQLENPPVEHGVFSFLAYDTNRLAFTDITEVCRMSADEIARFCYDALPNEAEYKDRILAADRAEIARLPFILHSDSVTVFFFPETVAPYRAGGFEVDILIKKEETEK